MSNPIRFEPISAPEPGETITATLHHLGGIVETLQVKIPDSGFEPRLIIGAQEYMWASASGTNPTAYRFWSIAELERIQREADQQ